MSASKQKKKKNSTGAKDFWLWPAAVAMGLVPCIVRAYEYDTHLDQFDWGPTEPMAQIDFFLFGKMVAIIVSAAIMLILLLYKISNDRRNMDWKKPFFLMVGYTGFVILSFLFSPYKGFVAGGSYEMFESIWAVLGYIVIMFYTYYVTNTEADIVKLLSIASVGAGIVYIIGIFQYLNLDLFKSKIGKALMLWPKYWEYKDGISFTFPDGYIYTTLYNVDYISLFVGAWFPVFVFLAFVDKKIWKKVIWGLLALASPLMLIGSTATTGVLAVVAGVVIVAIIILSRKKGGIFIGAGIAVAVIAAGIVFINSPQGAGLRMEVFGTYSMKDVCELTDIRTSEEGVDFVAGDNDEKLHLEMVDHVAVLTKEDGSEVAMYPSAEGDNVFVVADPGVYNGAVVRNMSDPVQDGDNVVFFNYVVVDMFNTRWILTNEYDGVNYLYYNDFGKWVSIDGPKYYDILNVDFLTGRGNIWNRVLYVLPSHIFIGSGANTYLYATPQDSYIFENYHKALGTYDVKAHNWFVNMTVEEGLIATLLFIAFYIWYAVRAVILFRKGSTKDAITWLVLAMFSGTLIYMISAMANDSTVNTGIVFWVMLGLGLAANRIAEEKQKRCLEDAQSN